MTDQDTPTQPKPETQVVASKVQAAPELPGVYCFIAAADSQMSERVLYVGKAKNLRKRLQSYVRQQVSNKTAALMKLAADIECTVTNNETEALLLEQTLIKKHRPRFNILLRDDKSYPFLYVSGHQDYPYLMVRRGNQVSGGQLFGPYSNGRALRETLRLLQKVFRIRQCSDDFFANRSRPCLEYQIGRCTAPCMGYISVKDYKSDIAMAVHSIRGHNDKVASSLQQHMDEAAASLDYEKAAAYRDRLIALRKVQEQQTVAREEGQVDVIALEASASSLCIQQLLIRSGKVVASKSFFPGSKTLVAPLDQHQGEAELLEQFISQHYLQQSFRPDMPREIFVNYRLPNKRIIEQALANQQQYRVALVVQPRGERMAWLQLAQKNAQQALQARTANRRYNHERAHSLAKQLGMKQIPNRIECFDISHTFGEETMASCVVFGADGPRKAAYRIFSIKDITPGDDYAAMRQALTRRFANKDGQPLPELLIVDGGKGQLSMALGVLTGLAITLTVVGIAKGPGRKAGLETLFVQKSDSNSAHAPALQLQLRPDSPALHLLQHVRDESHRFALMHHRKRRAKARKTSQLETIAGVGPTKRRDLLRYFGSLEGVINASEYDLAKVKGISAILARTIYNQLH